MVPQNNKLSRMDRFRLWRWCIIVGGAIMCLALLVLAGIVSTVQSQHTERTAFTACAQQSDPQTCVKQLLGAATIPDVLEHCGGTTSNGDDYARCVKAVLDN